MDPLKAVVGMDPLKAIVGTAGHIDHGKTALVRALTGIDTDRLPEERERGISIELGFAHLDVDGVGRAGVVDVPGHERFIRQMLAGAHGFDLVLVVVAADDGVMPQTEEHFDIVHLLGVERAIFVVTKIDAVAPGRIAEVESEIEILAVGTRFENAPVHAVSARTGEGIDRLRAAIAEALRSLPPKRGGGVLRIPIDRVFVSKGRGTIVTGTAVSGTVTAGLDVLLQPSARSARVRELQVHGEPAPSATAGQRVAVNLAGVEKDDVARGDTITTRGGAHPTSRFDARVEIRPAAGKPLASHARVRVHHATRETFARLVWLDGAAEVAPRSHGLAQISLAEPLVAAAGDRFVLRDQTAARTIGGGVVLLAEAQKHRRSEPDVPAMLGRLEHGDSAARVAAVVAMSASFGIEPAAAASAAGLEHLPALEDVSGVVALPDRSAPELLVAAARFEALASAVASAVDRFHREQPNLAGVDLEHLRGEVRGGADARAFRLVVDALVRRGTLVRSGNLLHAKTHRASLSAKDDDLAAQVLARIEAAGATPPAIKELAAELGVDVARATRVAGVLVLRGSLVRVSPDLLFSPAAIDDIRTRLVEHLSREGEITASGFRDLIAASRKYGIPLLDWLDRAGVTIRVGDVRRLRRS